MSRLLRDVGIINIRIKKKIGAFNINNSFNTKNLLYRLKCMGLLSYKVEPSNTIYVELFTKNSDIIIKGLEVNLVGNNKSNKNSIIKLGKIRMTRVGIHEIKSTNNRGNFRGEYYPHGFIDVRF
jgi:hypothetical protein